MSKRQSSLITTIITWGGGGVREKKIHSLTYIEEKYPRTELLCRIISYRIYYILLAFIAFIQSNCIPAVFANTFYRDTRTGNAGDFNKVMDVLFVRFIKNG